MSETPTRAGGPDRRAFLAYFGSMGLGSTLFPGVLWARVAAGEEITTETIACAEEIAGLEFTPAERELMLEDLQEQQEAFETLRAVPLPNHVPPAIHFSPLLPGMELEVVPEREPLEPRRVALREVPNSIEELAFLSVPQLAELVRTRRVSSLDLTQMYLRRLRRYDELLQAAVTITEERALAQARAMDEELARGRYRGPLHGIPWGAKDLLAVKGYPTTWGAEPYRDQVIEQDATVVQRLDEAGAVLIAKLSLGALAWGDVWFGGTTKNPWNPEQGASGSSAGPGSATAAGLVGFSIGSETLGSISSPSTRNGVTGLRPTYGRVPRTGAMALSWTMDKLGPMCRSVEGCALVFDAIHGTDGYDLTVRDAAFRWDPDLSPRRLRVGYFAKEFERDTERYRENRPFDQASLEVLRSLGAELIPVELPELGYDAMTIILSAEAGAAFDELTRSDRDELLVRQERRAWPNVFRAARFIPAVEYINANRVRTLAMEAWARLFDQVDVIVTPTGSAQLTATNLTGHPAVILPNGFREDGTPVSITFLGRLYGEDRMLAVAHAYQEATDFHLRHPELDR